MLSNKSKSAVKRIAGSLALILAVAMPACSQTVLTNGLVAYYPFNGNANDASGNGYNGTNQGATATTNHLGAANSAYYFNGNAEVVLPMDIFTNDFSSGTISAWVNLNANNQGTIFSREHDGIDTYCMFTVGTVVTSHGYQDGGGTPGNLYFHADDANPESDSTGSVPIQAWHQVVVEFSPTNCSFYIDGTPSGGSPGNFSIPPDSLAINSIGAQEEAGPYYYGLNGSIDDLRVYDLALSASQVAQLYAAEARPGYPVITTDLTNIFAVFGSNYTLSGMAQAATNISYQWYYTNGTVQGLASAYAQTVSGFVYGAVVTNGGFGYGNSPHVSFVGGGGSGAAGYGTASNGTLVSITVTNAGSGYTSLPKVVIDPPNGFLLGQTNNTLVLENIGTNDIGDYWFVASTAGGSATSTMASLSVVYPPTITSQPVLVAAPLHGSATFSVTAAGTAPLQYQWSLAGTNLSTATNSVFSLSSINTNQAGFYTVTASNPYGQATSTPAELAILPSITIPFTGAVGLWGQSATLTVGAFGTGTLQYQWLQNGVPVSGATNSSLSFSSIQFTNAGAYSVVVSSSFGSVTNGAYQVVVNPSNISLGLYPGITIIGTVGYVYQIQSSTNLSNLSGWVTETNITLTQAVENWYDANANTAQPGHPQKFYKVVAGN